MFLGFKLCFFLRPSLNTCLLHFKDERLTSFTFIRDMSSHGKSKRDSRGRQKKRRDESESESYSSDSDGSDDLSPPRSSRRRKGSSSRRTRRHSSSDDSSDSDGGRKSKKRSSSKDFSEEKLKDYMAKRAQKKVTVLFYVSLFVSFVFNNLFMCLELAANFLLLVIFVVGIKCRKETEDSVSVGVLQ